MTLPIQVEPMQVFSHVHKLLVHDDGRLINVLQRVIGQNSGATAIEYGLLAALIAVAAVAVMGTVGTNLSSTFNTVANNL